MSGWRDLPVLGAPRPTTPNFKEPRAKAKAALAKTRTERASDEKKHKATVRFRDKYCRVPLCGCRRIKMRAEVSHDRHKGQHGDPSGERSLPNVMIYLCAHRHQEGRVSRHAQTLRNVYLTEAKNNGPVAWEIKVETLRALLPDMFWPWAPTLVWVEVARERAVQNLEPLLPWQEAVWRKLAEMEW